VVALDAIETFPVSLLAVGRDGLSTPCVRSLHHPFLLSLRELKESMLNAGA